VAEMLAFVVVLEFFLKHVVDAPGYERGALALVVSPLVNLIAAAGAFLLVGVVVHGFASDEIRAGVEGVKIVEGIDNIEIFGDIKCVRDIESVRDLKGVGDIWCRSIVRKSVGDSGEGEKGKTQ